MALSAYSSTGLLKKNPLMGTSLLVDPNRANTVSQYNELYKEAQGKAGQGREGMLKTLVGRYQALGNPSIQRINAIQGSLNQINQRAANVATSPEMADVNRAVEIAQANREKANKAKGGLDSLSPGLKKIAAQGLIKAIKNYNSLTPAEKMASMKGGTGSGKMASMKNKTFSYKDYFKYLEDQALQEQHAYQNELLGNIQAEALPLMEEQQKRQAVLDNRANLYNMFLGA